MADNRITINAEFGQNYKDLGFIGRVGENDSREIVFDCADALTQFPGASIVCVIKRACDTKPYSAVLADEGYNRILPLSAVENAVAGQIMIELRAVSNDTILKSAMFSGRISESLQGEGDRPGNPVRDVLDRVDSALQSATETQEKLLSALDGVDTAVDGANTAAENAQAVADTVQAKLDNGEFVGPAGKDGADGAPGKDGKDGAPGPKGDTGATGPKGDTYDDREVRADIRELKGDLSGIAVFKRINLNDENLATDGYFYNPSGVPQRNSFYSYSDFIPVKKGDTVRCLADTTINNKAITFFDKNKTFLFQTTNSSGERPSTRAVWKYLDSGTKIIYTISYTLNEEAAYVRYSYATETKGIADMFTVNTEMPIDYIPYSSKNVSIEEKVKIPSADQIEDFEEKVKKVKKVSNLKGLKIGFLGDSFTDVTNYYGAMIAERTGIISYNYGKQGSRIYADNTVFGNIVQSFWKRALSMENELDCIVVFGGINDGSSRAIYETNLGTIDDTTSTREQIEAGETPTTFYAACKTVCELLMDKYPEKKVLMVIPPHVLNSNYDISLKAYMGIEKIIEAERNVADFYGIPVCDLWKNCTEMNNFQGNVAIYRIGSSNDIHPNTKGQYAMSVLIQKSLENLFD